MFAPFRGFATTISVTLLLALEATSSPAQSGWDRYKPGTLAAVIAVGDSTIRGAIRETQLASHAGTANKSQHFLGDDFPTVASVVYEGESRPINPIRRRLIADWGRTYRRDSSIVADFHREYLFRENGKLLWIPVQDTVASFFPKELRRGRRVSLFVMLLGGYYDAGEITWAFIVNEFRADPITQ